MGRRLAIPFVVLVTGVALASPDRGGATGPPAGQPDCEQLRAVQANKQANPHAASLWRQCQGFSSVPKVDRLPSIARQGALGSRLGTSDVNLVTGFEGYPSISQGGSMSWGNATDVVTVYGDSRNALTSYSGMSVSTDGGITFARLTPNPFQAAFTGDMGSPAVVYDASGAQWMATALVGSCGGQGIGVMTTTTPATSSSWTAGPCAHSGTADDRPILWADNNAGSPYYGRVYVSFNDFAPSAGGDLKVVYLSGGVWTEVTVDTAFIRNVHITGSTGTDGTVFILGMDEGGGQGNNRSNLIYRSIDGGATWSKLSIGPSFPAPGVGRCIASDYFYMVPPIWRHMGWGQGAVGPGGVVHYTFCRAGAVPGDVGDIYYMRSTDNGLTWSGSIPLNTDQVANNNVVQWNPSIAVTSQGYVLASWYDRRYTLDGLGYQYYGRLSLDNGVTWLPDEPISDVIIDQPMQVDPDLDYCLAGDSNFHAPLENDSLVTWTDGRQVVQGDNEMDVYFDRVPLCAPITVAPTILPNGIVGQAYSETVTATGGTAPYTFSLSGSLPTGLNLDTNTGIVDGTPTAAGITSFTITATDGLGCTGSQDYSLIIDPSGCPAITVSPATLPNGLQGAPYAQTLTASGGASPYTWSVTSGALPSGLTLGGTTGVIDGTPTESGAYTFRATAMDANGCTGSLVYTLTITCPVITLSPPTQLPDAYAGVPYLVNITGNGGTAPYKFEIVTGTQADGMFLGEGGTLYGTPTSGGTKNFRVRAVDVNGCTGEQQFTFNSNNCFPGAKLCEPFNGGLNTFTATSLCGGGAEWAGVNNCPSSDDIGHTRSHHARWGVLGNCETYGNVQSQDRIESTVIDVSSCNSGFTVLRFTYLMGFEGENTEDRARVEVIVDGGAPVVVADNGGTEFACTAPGNNNVKNLEMQSGWQSMELTIASTSTFQVRFVAETENGTDNDGEGFYVDDVSVQCLCPSNMDIDPDSLPEATVNVAYSQTLTATGGAPPYTWSTLPGNPVPAGLALDSLTGVISGIPTNPGIYTFTIVATDSNFCKVSIIYNLIVKPATCPTITLTPASFPVGTVGTFYSVLVTASGGLAPYVFFVTAGVLPPGLALDPDLGIISGNPTTAGIYPFTLTAVDANFCTGSVDYTIIIQPVGCPPITLSPTTLPNGDVGIAYTQTITATGGVTPYSWYITSGALPVGLTLSQTSGVISGAPLVAGTYNFTVTAQDATLCTGSQNYTILVDPRPPTDIVVGEGLGMTNGNLVKAFTATGGTTPVNFAAYGAGRWGTNVTTGEVNGDDYDEIMTGPGPGDVYGPHVRGFTRTGTPMAKINFYAYSTLKYGANVSNGDVEKDGYGEILTGAGPGAVFGPHVRGWNFDNVGLTTIAKINFFAYSTLKYGVNVADGDVDGDFYDEILTGAGPGNVFGPIVRGFNYDNIALSAMAKINFGAFTTAGYGVNVAGGDVEADLYDEIACSPGPGPTHPAQFKGFDFDGGPIAALPGYDVTAYTTLFGGRVGLGDVTVNGTEDLLTGAGRAPSATSLVKTYNYTGAALVLLPTTFTAFSGDFYGVNVTSGALGY